MRNNVIPIRRRGSQVELTKLYMRLLNAALNEAAASVAPQAWADDLSIGDLALPKTLGAQGQALLNGALEIVVSPENGCPSSRIRKVAK
jgi:hypothetical protein